MLASITPLGERSRGFSWRVTATAFAIGAIGAGAATGALLGGLGSLLPGGEGWRGGVAIAVLAGMLLFDATPLHGRLPTSRRQVNEDWLARYRGWVYGFGFGAQLGLGVVTIVSSAAVYAWVALLVLAPNAFAGALIGAVFGVVRALSLLPARTVEDPQTISLLHRRLTAAQRPVERASWGLELIALAVAIGVLAW
jgi:hypothetical protein